MTEEKTEDKLKVVRFNISPQLHQAFKMRCVASGVSMKDRLIQFMTEYAMDERPID